MLTSSRSSATTEATLNTKSQLKEDVEALASLIYDIFKELQTNANVDHDQNSESYNKEEKR